MKKIFRAAAIITCNEDHEVIEDGFIAIENEKIIDVGPWKKRPKTRSFAQEEARSFMITPGLFNLHTHLSMTLLRGVAEDLHLKQWLYDVIFPLEKQWVTPDFVRVGAELALCESLRNGVTFVGDMYFFEEEVAKAVHQMKMRGFLAQSLMDIPTPDAKNKDEAWKRIRNFLKKYRNHPRIIPGIAPHAPYTCSFKTLKEASRLALEMDVPVMIHLAESQNELEETKKKTGKTPVHYLSETELFQAKHLLLAHSVWLEKEDYSLLSRPNISVVLNPQCNAKLGSGVPRIEKLLKKGVRVTLGTDGPASNNNLDIFSEMNFISKIHHVIEKNLQGVPGPILFDTVTRKAAEAMGLEEKLGSLEPGKEADFIMINLETPHLTPLTRPYSHLIYSVQGPDVDSVYVAGQCLMKNKKILVIDEKKVLSKARTFWNKIKSTI